MEQSKEKYIFRRSAVILVFRIIIIEILFLLFHMGMNFVFYYYDIGEILLGPFELRLVFFGLLHLVNVLIVIYFILEWVHISYVITKNEIIKLRGIIRRKSDTYDIGEIQNIKVRQGIVGRIFNYGTISFKIVLIEKRVKFEYISDPHKVAGLCEKFKLSASKGPLSEIIPEER